MKKKLSLLVCIALTMSLLAGCGSKEEAAAPEETTEEAAAEETAEEAVDEYEEITIKIAHTAADSHIFNVVLQELAANVKEKTGGNVTVEVYANGELGDATALCEQVSLGSVDITFASMSGIATYIPKVNAMSAPFLFESYEQADKVIDAFISDWINADAPEMMNTVSLGVFDYGFRQVTTKGIEVNSPDDLKGVKLRVPPSAGLQAAFNALGCNTQTIAYAELYTALKQGTVDGEENPVGTILADCYYECQDELAITNHFFDCQALMVNEDLWNSYSENLRTLLQEEVTAAVNTVREYVSSSEADTIAELESHGMHVTYPDIAEFKAKMDPAYEEIGELSGQEAMQELLDAIETYGK